MAQNNHSAEVVVVAHNVTENVNSSLDKARDVAVKGGQGGVSGVFGNSAKIAAYNVTQQSVQQNLGATIQALAAGLSLNLGNANTSSFAPGAGNSPSPLSNEDHIVSDKPIKKVAANSWVAQQTQAQVGNTPKTPGQPQADTSGGFHK